MFARPNPASGIPIYLQVMEQIKHGIETGALKAGDQLPGIRTLAEWLVINPNTVAKVYRELEHEGFLEIRHGAGAFVTARSTDHLHAARIRSAQPLVIGLVEELRGRGLSYEEIRRLFEAALIRIPGSGAFDPIPEHVP